MEEQLSNTVLIAVLCKLYARKTKDFVYPICKTLTDRGVIDSADELYELLTNCAVERKK